MDKSLIVGKVNPITYFKQQEFEGRSCYVFPVIMMVEGVHQGANAELPIYYPAEELARYVSIWNTKPVVIEHPYDHSEESYISACSVPVLEQHKVGEIMNAHMDGNKLKAEAWLDIEMLNERAPEVLQKIRWGETLEVSIGCFLQKEMTSGTWRDELYGCVARDITPDHLAILLTTEGACSVQDGAGLPRVNQKHEVTMEKIEINIAPLEGILNGFVQRMGEIQAKLLVSATDPKSDDDKEPEAELPENTPEAPEGELFVDEVKQEESPMTIQEFVASASPEIQLTLNEGLALLEKQKSELVSKVLANSAEVYTKEELAAMSVAELQKLDKLVQVHAKEPQTDYSVNGVVVDVVVNSAEMKAYTPEVWV